MKKNTLSTLMILSGTTLLVLSYLSGTNTNASAVNGYECGSEQTKYKNEIYYNKVDVNQEVNSEETGSKSNNEIQVSDNPIAGIAVELEKSSVPEDEVILPDTKNIDQYTYNITSEERKILDRIVEAECTGQNQKSKMNVASVIINRVNSSSFPDDIEGVVFQKNQFSPIGDHRYYEVEITKGTQKAVDKVLKDGVTNRALYFCNPADIESSKNKKWFKKLTYLFTDDSGHSFYTE